MAALSFRDPPLAMSERRRRLSVAVLAFILAASAAPIAAQVTNTAAPSTAPASTTVGPPQAKDFRLPGQRTTPPARPQPTQPEPTVQAPPPAATQPSTTRPAPRTPPRTTARQPEQRPAPQAAPPPASSAPAPAAPIPESAPPPTGFESALPPARPAAPPAPAPAASAGSWSTWLWIGGGLLLALLGLFGIRRLLEARAAAARRAQREARAAERVAAAEAEAAAEAARAAMPRARLELSFTPDRAVATDSETIVHYEIVLRNAGNATAHNIRIDPRMFNASAQRAIAAFLKGPIHEQSGSPMVRIAPGEELKLSSQIAMPKDEVRSIEVQGRTIFVPIVAINVAYDWGEGENAGSGRTSMSWLVGREPDKPSDKMGPFRLDLGPRVYRSVGQRPTQLANVA